MTIQSNFAAVQRRRAAEHQAALANLHTRFGYIDAVMADNEAQVCDQARRSSVTDALIRGASRTDRKKRIMLTQEEYSGSASLNLD